MKTLIVLSDAKSIYHPGDKVSGVVKISTSSSADIAKITVSLKGLIHTHIVFVKYWHSQSNFKKSVQLFAREISIFDKPYTIKPGDHEWPFEFLIPEQCEKHESQEFDDKKSTIFDDDIDQDLAPTTPEVTSKNFTTSGNSFSISYPLTATVILEKTIGSKQDVVVEQLNIQPLRDAAHPTWRSVTQTCKFQTVIGNAAENPKRRSSIFKRRGSVQPESNFSFSLNARIATITVLGKPVPLFLSLVHDDLPDTNGSTTPPKFEIKSITATLNTENVLRSRGSHQEFYLSGSPESMWTDTISFGSKLLTPVPIEAGDSLDVRNLLTDFSIPTTETLSFFSFSLCRLHEMKVKVEIECNGQPFAASFTTKRTIVLSQYYKDDVASAEKDKEAKEPEDCLTDRRNDSFAEVLTPGNEPPPSFTVATSDGEVLPSYSRDGSY